MLNAPSLEATYTDLYDYYMSADLCKEQNYFQSTTANGTDGGYAVCSNFSSGLAT
jgi:hypothetical protein